MGTTQNPSTGTEQSYVAQLADAILGSLSPDPETGPEWIGQERTTARLNGQPAPVHQTHRRRIIPGTRDYEPVALTVLAPVALSLDDATAVLFGWETSYEELAEDSSVRALVADAVINEGGQRIEELRSQLSTQALDAEQRAYLAYCRNRAAEVFTARPVEQSSRRDRVVAGGGLR